MIATTTATSMFAASGGAVFAPPLLADAGMIGQIIVFLLLIGGSIAASIKQNKAQQERQQEQLEKARERARLRQEGRARQSGRTASPKPGDRNASVNYDGRRSGRQAATPDAWPTPARSAPAPTRDPYDVVPPVGPADPPPHERRHHRKKSALERQIEEVNRRAAEAAAAGVASRDPYDVVDAPEDIPAPHDRRRKRGSDAAARAVRSQSPKAAAAAARDPYDLVDAPEDFKPPHDHHDDHSTVVPDVTAMSANQLARAIVLSEIFGKPAALRNDDLTI